MVASLANFFAVGIKYYIGMSFFILIPCGFFLIWKLRDSFSLRAFGIYLGIFLVGGLLFYLNNPSDTFLRQEGNQGLILSFNDHYTYYSSQSLEMLSAEYPSRLKAMNLFPQPWAKYHFFNSAAQAISQFFLPQLNLFSYFVAQFILGTWVLLSLLELLWLSAKGFGFQRVLMTGVWAFFGFSFFGSSLVWTLGTTGTFSVFSIFYLVWSLLKNERNSILIYSVLLGASAFRFVPMVGLLMALWIYQDLGRAQLGPWFLTRNILRSYFRKWPILFCFCALFLSYVFLTFICGGKNMEGKFFAGPTYDDGWMAILSFHNVLSTLFTSFFNWTPFRLRDPAPIFLSHLPSSFLSGCFILVFGLSLSVIFFKKAGGYQGFLDFFERVHLIPKRFAKVGLFLIFVLLIGAPKLVFISSLYLFFIGAILLILKKHSVVQNLRSVSDFVLVMILVTVGLILTGSNGVKAPMSYVTFDLVLWSLLSAFFLDVFSRRSLWGWAFILLAFSFFGFQFSGLYRYPEMLAIRMETFDNLKEPPVDENRFLSEELVEKSGGDIKVLEAYSALFNARLHYSPDFEPHRNFYHVTHPR